MANNKKLYWIGGDAMTVEEMKQRKKEIRIFE